MALAAFGALDSVHGIGSFSEIVFSVAVTAPWVFALAIRMLVRPCFGLTYEPAFWAFPPGNFWRAFGKPPSTRWSRPAREVPPWQWSGRNYALSSYANAVAISLTMCAIAIVGLWLDNPESPDLYAIINACGFSGLWLLMSLSAVFLGTGPNALIHDEEDTAPLSSP